MTAAAGAGSGDFLAREKQRLEAEKDG